MTRVPLFIGIAMTAVSLMLLAMMVWVRHRIPASADLYHLVYDGSRPGKPEGTDKFLFIFPLFCLGASVGVPISFWRDMKRQDEFAVPKLVFAIGGFMVFGFGTLVRWSAVTSFYGI